MRTRVECFDTFEVAVFFLVHSAVASFFPIAGILSALQKSNDQFGVSLAACTTMTDRKSLLALRGVGRESEAESGVSIGAE